MRIKNVVVLTIFSVIALVANSQNRLVNFDIDTNLYKNKEALQLWLDFLESESDSLGSKYWNAREVNEFGPNSYFLLENELQFGATDYLEFISKYAEINVLRITEQLGYFKITSSLAFADYNGKSNVQYIFHVYAGREDGVLKLYNPLPINTKLEMRKETLGKVNYFYEKHSNFDEVNAKKQTLFLQQFSDSVHVQMDTVNFYYLTSVDEYLKLKGLEFCVGYSGESIPLGKVYNSNTVLIYGLGAFYPHEVIHLVINKKYKNCHHWVNEGVATYFGMSRGKSLDWHLQRVNKYLQEHPEIDLNEMISLQNLDQYTSFKYCLGGLLAQIAYEKDGYSGIIKILNGGEANDDFYNLWMQYLQVNRSQINESVRSILKEQY